MTKWSYRVTFGGKYIRRLVSTTTAILVLSFLLAVPVFAQEANGPIVPVLQSITVQPSTSTINVGASQQFTATGTYSDHTAVDVTSKVTWTIDNQAIATLKGSGLAVGIAAGTATITATSGPTISGRAVLIVTTAPPVIAPTSTTPARTTPPMTIPPSAIPPTTSTSSPSLATAPPVTSSPPPIAPTPTQYPAPSTPTPGYIWAVIIGVIISAVIGGVIVLIMRLSRKG